jgi:hypothetical protein
LQTVSDQVAAYCQQQIGLQEVPNVSTEGLEILFSEHCKLQLFLQEGLLWFLLDLGPSSTRLESWIANTLEQFDAPLCFFRAFTTTNQHLCVATALGVNDISNPNLDLVFERCHRIGSEAGGL